MVWTGQTRGEHHESQLSPTVRQSSHVRPGGRILGSVPPENLEDGCYRSSRANHFAIPTEEAGLQGNASPVKGLVIVAACAATVLATTLESR
jgi:hypothetical protein